MNGLLLMRQKPFIFIFLMNGGDDMDVLDRILELRKERNWSEYRLAEESGITQSTISSWYRKNMIPTIPSLSRICDAFDITLSQFFLEDKEHTVFVNDIQIELLKSAEKLNEEQMRQLITFLNIL